VRGISRGSLRGRARAIADRNVPAAQEPDPVAERRAEEKRRLEDQRQNTCGKAEEHGQGFLNHPAFQQEVVSKPAQIPSARGHRPPTSLARIDFELAYWALEGKQSQRGVFLHPKSTGGSTTGASSLESSSSSTRFACASRTRFIFSREASTASSCSSLHSARDLLSTRFDPTSAM
jgi:hypothetical protein